MKELNEIRTEFGEKEEREREREMEGVLYTKAMSFKLEGVGKEALSLSLSLCYGQTSTGKKKELNLLKLNNPFASEPN